MHMRAILAGSALLSTLISGLGSGCDGAMPQPPPEPPAVRTSARPRLVVLIVVDQLPSWWFEATRQHLSGGLARLLRQGVYYPEAAYPYAVTFTAAGHAALGSGTPPAVNGVADNERWVPAEKAELPVARDPDSPVFILAGNPTKGPGDGRSSAALLVDGVADVLERETRGAARTVSISLKDRSAVFVGGKKPDLAIWFDDSQPAMTTSRFYVDSPPEWLRALAQQGQVAQYLGYSWTRLPGLDHAAITGLIDAEPGEYNQAGGLGPGFPHELSRVKNPAKDLGATPAGDLLVFDTARAAIAAEGLGADQVSDFLALSFSSQDVVGHYWGPDSWERLDILMRFDVELGRLLDELDQRFGPEGYALALTSDHGIAPLVEHTRKRGGTAHRNVRSDLRAMAEGAVDGLLGQGPGDWLVHVSDNSVFIGPALDQHPRRADALAVLVQRIRALPGIQYAEQTERLRGDCEKRDGIERLACYSIVPRDPGEIYFAAAPGSIVSRHPQGTNHGSPNPDDRLVPILVYAPGNLQWNTARIAREPVSTLQVAATLAALLGVSPPPQATAPPLP
ncbi:MAG TPA: alkaline phosphatase family protein [Haliangium sp.]|nr:alkaline phosphatase family protein [Haliangium sp.]